MAALLALSGLATSVSAETLVLGSVSDNIKKHLTRFGPMAEYLEAELADDGVTSVEVLVLTNSDAMVRALENGEVDLYFDSPLVAARVALGSGAEPMLRRWKKGVGSYHSVIFVPADSEIQTIADLAGRTIAFQEPDSTSGFLLPAGMLRSEGLEIEELSTRDSAFAPDAVGYIFTMNDRNTLAWIHRGWVDAAATDPQRFEELDTIAPGAFRTIARSIEVPRQVVVRRQSLDPQLTAAIEQTLLDMEHDAVAQVALNMFHKTTRFDRFPGGVDATFDPIYELLGVLREQNIF